MTNPAKFKNEKHFRITFHQLCLFRETVLYSQQSTGISLHTKMSEVFGFMDMGLDFTWPCLLDSLNITLFTNSKANWCSMILTSFLLFYIWAFCPMKAFSYLSSNYVCEHEWCFPHWENGRDLLVSQMVTMVLVMAKAVSVSQDSAW